MQKQELEYDFKIVEVVNSLPSREKPAKESMGKKIILEVLLAKGKYIKIPYEKVKDHYKSPVSCSRGLGRQISSMKLQEKLSVFTDGKDIYLEKMEQKKKEK